METQNQIIYNKPMSKILIGTSGYDHPELKGSFYPDDLPRKDFLSFYATKFNALELNSTFYGMPTAERIQSFYDRAQGKLSFTIKANRLLTHEIDRNWQNYAQEFATALKPLQEKSALSSVLVQFPESFHYTVDNRYYLAGLIKNFREDYGLPVVIEFRHREWIRQSVLDGLSKRDTGIVFCDMPKLKNLPNGFEAQTPFIGSHAYIRFHGRNAQGWYVNGTANSETPRYDYEYSEAELASFVPIIRTAEAEGKTVQMYFNNHPKGSGFKNALMMQELLKK